MHKEWERKIEREITSIFDGGLTAQNIEMAGMLVDMWKDMKEVCYWDDKMEHMEMKEELMQHEMKTHQMHHDNPESHEASYGRAMANPVGQKKK